MTTLDSPRVDTNVWFAVSGVPEANRGFENDYAMVGLTGGAGLLAGGADAAFAAIAASAMFDPATELWAATDPMTTSRRLHTVSALLDGTALAVGGISGPYRVPFAVTGVSERFDPDARKWSPTRTGMGTPRCLHSATVLEDGRVLVAGGATLRDGSNLGSTVSAEIYDPEHDSWTPTGSMTDPRSSHQAVRLADGRVLVVGGGVLIGTEHATPSAFCEIYDPSTGKWSVTGSLATPRFLHRATLLPDGSVLALGGATQGWVQGPIFDMHSLATTERWYPATQRWAPAARMPLGRARFQAITLRTGLVLAFGGGDEQNLSARYATSVLYDPIADTWGGLTDMGYGRIDFAAALLKNGKVLAAGGNSADDLVEYTSLYTP